jgi:hypothetical protein
MLSERSAFDTRPKGCCRTGLEIAEHLTVSVTSPLEVGQNDAREDSDHGAKLAPVPFCNAL